MRKYPEDKELVDTIVKEWKIKYKRLLVMIDELDNI